VKSKLYSKGLDKSGEFGYYKVDECKQVQPFCNG